MYYTLPLNVVYRILFIFLCCVPTGLFAQTLLRPGDLAVLGLAANTGDGSEGCTAMPGTDVLSIVAFREIETGTAIDITDNGWERSLPGFWGNREGFVRMVRTGPALKAGEVIRLRFPPSGSRYEAVAPDTAWTFEDLGATSVNFNAAGDQLFFLQGGSWNGGTSGGDDASYVGGHVLCAFNSRREWIPFQNNSTDSGLPVMLDACYRVQSGGETADFLAYAGDTAATDRLGWLTRVHDERNWRSFESCAAFASLEEQLRMLPDTIGLFCQQCGACEVLQDSITVALPDLGGPFTVDYTDGRDTFQLSDISNGYRFGVRTTDTLVLTLLAVRDGSGCGIFSELGEPLVLVASPPPHLFAYPDQSSCGPFVLPPIVGESLSGSQAYYLDSARMTPALLPGAVLSSDRIVYVYDRVYTCETARSFAVTIEESPEVGIGVLSQPSCGDPEGGALELYTRGNGPFSIFWNREGFDGLQELSGLTEGTYRAEVVDANGCQAIAEVQLSSLPGPVLSCQLRQEFSPEGETPTGSAVLFFSGGKPPYTLSWTGPVSGMELRGEGDSLELVMLPSGQYEATLTDGAGCTSTCTFEIRAQNLQECDLEFAIEVSDATCASGGLGSLRLDISGGEAPFVATWDGGIPDGLLNAENLLPGAYAFTLTDAGECVQSGVVEIGAAQNTAIGYTVDQPACALDETGALLIHTLESGTLPLMLIPGNGSDTILISVLPYTLAGLAIGDHTFRLIDGGGCLQEIAFTIREPVAYTLDLGSDLLIGRGDSIVLGEGINIPGTARWTPPNFLSASDRVPVKAFPFSSMTYALTITTPEGCIYRDDIRIGVNEFSREIFVPNAFSPDNDGQNDRFVIFGSERVRAIRRLIIFNRWGEQLFDKGPMLPADSSSGWDGRHNGVAQPAGVYVYRAEIQLEGGISTWISGDFLLLR
ncbi:MAG: gliding motility-associated C-terminal domain-containing protein [Saprospiraceae bacterium]|nr:gliding motility-associated C-terminal domain-containing protein [Saprospiraceae bacterium]